MISALQKFAAWTRMQIGDLWFYSLMIFIACRSGDVIQAFIGLWLVPKYVGAQELGAVLPLQQLTSFLTIPLTIIAVVFSKYVNTYATRGEFGKVKSFTHDVFVASGILFITCIIGAYLIMPFFYERLRIASGSLTFLILLCGLITNIGAIIGSAQQGLKRFKVMSLLTLVSAPIRLFTLLFTMPIRALSGYILGQTTPVATTSACAIWDIHNKLIPYTPDTSWRKDIPKIIRYLTPFAICTIISSAVCTMTATIYRQRLPEIESAAYYLLTRFSDIASFIGAAINIILFPLASEAHEQGNESRKLLWHSVFGIMLGCFVLSIVFAFIAKPLLMLNSVWREYIDYAYLLPVLTLSVAPSMASNAIYSYELACNRIKSMSILVSLSVLYTAFLIAFTGYEFFYGILPDSIVHWMGDCHIAQLSTITYCNLIFGIVALVILLIALPSKRSITTAC